MEIVFVPSRGCLHDGVWLRRGFVGQDIVYINLKCDLVYVGMSVNNFVTYWFDYDASFDVDYLCFHECALYVGLVEGECRDKA